MSGEPVRVIDVVFETPSGPTPGIVEIFDGAFYDYAFGYEIRCGNVLVWRGLVNKYATLRRSESDAFATSVERVYPVLSWVRRQDKEGT